MKDDKKETKIEVQYDEYMMGRDKRYPPTPKMIKDALDVCDRVTGLLNVFGEDRAVLSGYRPAAINKATPRAAKYSKHMYCQAVDLEDYNKKLGKFCLANIDLLEELGLWIEHPDFTDSWVHLQTRPPNSGRRVYIP